MMTHENSTDKFLVNCQEGANNLERATISFILATTASNTCETKMFLTSDAAPLCTKGGADGLVADGYEPISDLISQFLGNGGKIWLCKICAKVKNITEEDLLDGVEIVGAPHTMAFLAGGAHVLA